MGRHILLLHLTKLEISILVALTSQAPSQWRNKVRIHLNRTANMQVGYRTGKGRGKVNYTLTTLEALYAHAMWVDTEFYMTVVAAFTELTKDNTLQPQQTIKLQL